MTNKQTYGLVSSALLLGVLANAGCSQPPINCASAPGYFAAKYELESGDPSTPCAQLPGDVLGLETYYPDGGMRPDLDRPSLSIRPEYPNDLVFHALEQGVTDLTMDVNTNNIGDFESATPDSEDFCHIPTLNKSTLAIPEVPAVEDDPETPDEDESYPLQPATTISYDWSNFELLVSARAQGTQLSADLDFEQDGCQAKYHVTGLFPVVGCESDEDCDDDLNGISPDFATVCEPNLGLCVLKTDPPSFQDQ